MICGKCGKGMTPIVDPESMTDEIEYRCGNGHVIWVKLRRPKGPCWER